MKFLKYLLSIFALFLLNNANAQISIDPPFWYLGMPSDTLMLLINTEASGPIKELTPSATAPKVIWQQQDGDYYFAMLKLTPATPPGMHTYSYILANGMQQKFDYAIKPKNRKFVPRGISEQDIVYLLMPDRFCDGDTANNYVAGFEPTQKNKIDGRHGGDIKGMTQHINHIKNLGATAVWCTPVFEMNQSKVSYHQYGATNFYAIDPRFGLGTNKQLEEIETYVQYVERCHENNLAVVYDVVLNHVSIEHPWYINKTPKNWFHPKEQCNFMIPALTDPYANKKDIDLMEKGWFVPSMPDLNHDNPLVNRYLIQNTLWCIAHYKVDALRLDTQPFNKKEFLTEWSATIKKRFPTITIVGETWSANNSNYYIDYWQGSSTKQKAYNSSIEQVMHFPWMEAVITGLKNNDASKLYYCYALDNSQSNAQQRFIFLGNHDTERFFTSLGENDAKYEQAIVLLASTLGIPQFYYGDELGYTGVKGVNDGYMRADMNLQPNTYSEEQRKKMEFCKKLFTLRKSADWASLPFTHFIPRDNVYCYKRGNYYFMINFSDKQVTVDNEYYFGPLERVSVSDVLLSANSTSNTIAPNGFIIRKVNASK